jgi:hypothetical protein
MGDFPNGVRHRFRQGRAHTGVGVVPATTLLDAFHFDATAQSISTPAGRLDPQDSICRHRREDRGVRLLHPLFVGFVVAFKWQGIGGLLILGGLAFFAVVNDGIRFSLVFGPMIVVGLIYLVCGWTRVAG